MDDVFAGLSDMLGESPPPPDNDGGERPARTPHQIRRPHEAARASLSHGPRPRAGTAAVEAEAPVDFADLAVRLCLRIVALGRT